MRGAAVVSSKVRKARPYFLRAQDEPTCATRMLVRDDTEVTLRGEKSTSLRRIGFIVRRGFVTANFHRRRAQPTVETATRQEAAVLLPAELSSIIFLLRACPVPYHTEYASK